jgi:hypothetical protein
MKDKNRIITFIVIIVLLFIGLFFFARPGKNGNSPTSAEGIPQGAQELGDSHSAVTGGALTAPEKLYDFGTISMKNGDVTKDFTITNSTNNDIFVPTLTTSCMCTKAYIVESNGTTKGPFGMPAMGYVPPSNETIKAGESRIIRVVYDPNAHGPAGVGQIDRTITLTEKSGASLQLEIKALVTP